MRGPAKFFNTLQDVYNSLSVDKEGTKEVLRSLLKEQFMWVDTGIVTDRTKIKESDEVKVEEIVEGENVVLHRMELHENPNAYFLKLGLTVKQINELLEA